MLYENEFRCPEYAEKLLESIRRLSDQVSAVRIMEVCGTHTMAIAKSGLRQLLPPHVELISGPGCPVCVTPAQVIDEILRISSAQNITIATYGDLMRVPGSMPGDDLRRRKAMGADIRIVYSPMDAVSIAENEPQRQVVFLGVGFETTAPGTALSVIHADRKGLSNFSLLSLLKRTPPALQALVSQDDFHVSAFLCPGHVATIIGANAFEFLPGRFGLPAVVGGFENGDLLASFVMLLRQLADSDAKLENEYIRAVSPEGNLSAQKITGDVFVPCHANWRGLGFISDSGLQLRKEFSGFDASLRFDFSPAPESSNTPCRCGDVICGRISPLQCPLFGKACTPEEPVGPCMVSGEGACAAAYHYGRSL